MDDSDSDDLAKVELENNFYSSVKTTSILSIPLLFMLYFIFSGAYIYTGLKSPYFLNTTITQYNIPDDHTNQFVDIFATASHLEPSHQFIQVDLQFIRYLERKKENFRQVILVSLNNSLTFFNNRNIVGIQKSNLTSDKIIFEIESSKSQYIQVFRESIKKFDEIQINLNVRANLIPIQSLFFRYTFIDANVQSFVNQVRLVLSGCCIYAFILFLFNMFKYSLSFLQNILFILGGLSCFGCNPFCVLFNQPSIQLLTPYLMTFFVNVFRFYMIITFLVQIHPNHSSPNLYAIIFTSIFFIIYFYIELIVSKNDFLFIISPKLFGSYQKSNDSSQKLNGFILKLSLPESILSIFHIIYAIFFVVLMTKVLITVNNCFYGVSYSLFGIVSVIESLLVDIIMRINGKIYGTCLRFVGYEISHIMATSIFLFFEQSSREMYHSIDEKNLEEITELDGNMKNMEDDSNNNNVNNELFAN